MTARTELVEAATQNIPANNEPSVNTEVSNQNPDTSVQTNLVNESPEGNVSTEDQGKPELTEIDKLKHGYDKRLKKLSAKKNDYESKIADLEARLAAQENNANPEQPQIDRDDMTEDEYISHMVKQGVQDQLNTEYGKQAEYVQQMQQQEVAANAWQEKIDAFGKEDYAEIVGMAEQFIPNDVKSAIAQSDIGPALAYEISKDPSLVESLHNMDAQRRAWTVFNLENKIKNPVSQAAPTPDVHGSSTTRSADPSKMNMKEWANWRASQRNR